MSTLLVRDDVVVAATGTTPSPAARAEAALKTTLQQWSVAALRVACSTTVGLATLAFFAGAGGLGAKIYDDLTFKSNVVLASGFCVLLAVALEVLLVLAQRRLTPWTKAVPA